MTLAQLWIEAREIPKPNVTCAIARQDGLHWLTLPARCTVVTSLRSEYVHHMACDFIIWSFRQIFG
jgi:hypothetical protein